VAKRKYLKAEALVRAVDSGGRSRRYFRSKKALEKLVPCVCPCGENTFPTVKQMLRWEREGREPVAVGCSLDCANAFTAELAKGIPD
jgi:hypothetical protein